MTQSSSAIFVQASARASEEDPGQRLRVALASAFPPIVEGEVAGELPPAAVDSSLLNVVPAPAPLHFEELEAEVSRHRRLLARGAAAVPVTALIAVGGALLYHLLLGGLFALLCLFVARTVKPGESTANSGGEVGGSRMGYLFTGDVPEGNPTAAAASTPAGVPDPNVQPLTLPPPVFTPPVPQPQVALQQMLRPENDPVLIGIPAGGQDLGQIKTPPAAPPKHNLPTPPDAVGMQIEAPPASTPEQPALPRPAITAAGTGKSDAAPGVHGGAVQGGSSKAAGGDGLGDDDDEPVISLLRDGGHGGGQGKGEGLDRGISGADNPQPQGLDSPLPELKLWTNPPKHNPAFSVLVKASGKIGKVEVVEASGQPDLDEYLRVWIKDHWKYVPAMVHGKYVDMETRFTIKLTPQ